MKLTKKILSMILTLALVLGLLPVIAMATDAKEYVYLSVSFDGKYILDKNDAYIVYRPIPLEDIAAIDLEAYGLDNMLYDADGDGTYEVTALQLLIYAHEEIYGGNWSDVSFDAVPGSSYFRDGIFGFTENLVYFLNGDFPVDESQQSDFMTIGATSDRIVLKAGDFLDVASFGCYAFLWDMLGGFHLFADEDGNYVHDYTAQKGEALRVTLKHSFCDLMYGEAWVYEAADYEVYYGSTFGEAEGSVITDESGCAEITFSKAGTYYVWCDGGHGSDDDTHGACDYYFETYEPCIVSSPAYAKVTVKGEDLPKEDASLKLNHSLNLASDISINLAVPKTLLNGYDMKTVYVESTMYTYKNNEAQGTEMVRLLPVERGNYYYFTLDGLTAIRMNDTVSSVLYGTKNGQSYYSPVDEFSIATYAYYQLNSGATSGELKSLCADLLRYGAKAQIYKSYRTDNLADSAMTDEHKSYLSDLDAVTFGDTNLICNDLDNAPIAWAGKTLNLGSKVALKFVFRSAGYEGNIQDLSLRVSYEDISGKTKSLTLTAPELYSEALGYYAFTVDALLAAELRAVVSVQIYNGDTPVSCTLQYSADTYGKGTDGALGELCKALFAYSDSAKAYFSVS